MPRKHGLTVDNVVETEVVAAEGDIILLLQFVVRTRKWSFDIER